MSEKDPKDPQHENEAANTEQEQLKKDEPAIEETSADQPSDQLAQEEQVEQEGDKLESEAPELGDKEALQQDPAGAVEQAAAVVPAAAAPAKGNKGWMYVAIGLAVLLVIAVVKPPFGGASETVATVNGAKITKDQLYDTMISYGGGSMLDSLISDELLKQEADKAGIAVTDADIEKEIEAIKKSFTTEDEFNAWLQNYGMTMDSFREQVPQQVMLRKILEPQTGVTDEQVKQYYEDNKASYDTQEQVQASHILVKTKAEAEEILKQLKEGADFATIAKEKTLDEASKEAGGDLGFFPKGVMDSAFETAAFALKNPGDLSEPVETTYGFHIIKLTEHKAAVASTFEEKKEEIKTLLVSQKVSELSGDWLAGIKADADITNTLTDAAETESTESTTESTDTTTESTNAATE
ncbi:foldase protein PrsA [Paenibacillus phyllosphaerae]|uniref:Foldase protein PrsA n=1 Tax=Paenibacillus phyllosphaerae TaxID=274593 RepID=A0A7W5AVC7_9BACL|nr:peptidylprolyl isomerase [Paenibacillus phyllosphaerae]MBB3109342.1 foldase protein PrsA [Paenibacillus phyllosphaerae]